MIRAQIIYAFKCYFTECHHIGLKNETAIGKRLKVSTLVDIRRKSGILQENWNIAFNVY